jgi:2-phospho-L-lactate guanylyltransferase
MPADHFVTWSLIIPVKVLALAKSRLAGMSGPDRARLALAMAADTVAAAAACPAVAGIIVVTDDAVAGAELAGLGAEVIPDTPAAGLNAALVFGAELAGARWPGRGLAALTADLPAVRAAELGAALAAVPARPDAFVPDAAGSGTALYAAGPGVEFCPRFGLRSRAAHLAAGAVELDVPGGSGLRQDVDTAADLRAAERLGLGPRSAALLAVRAAPGGPGS